MGSSKKWPDLASVSIPVFHRFPYHSYLQSKNLAWVCVESSKKWPDLASLSYLSYIISLIHSYVEQKNLPRSAWSPQRNDLTWRAFLYLSYILSLTHSYVEQKPCLLPDLASVLILVLHRFPYSVFCRAKKLAWVCVESSKKWPDLASVLILVLHRFPYSLLCRAKTLPGSARSPQRNDLTWPAFRYCLTSFPLFTLM